MDSTLPRMGAAEGAPAAAGLTACGHAPEPAVTEYDLWHVTVTYAGAATDPDGLAAALRRLTEERPFLGSARYAADRVELRYWDEAAELQDAAAMALRLWSDHRRSAGLPDWHVVALEVLDRDTRLARGGGAAAAAMGLDDVRPMHPPAPSPRAPRPILG